MVDEEEHAYWLSLLGDLGSNQDNPALTAADETFQGGGESAFLYLDIQTTATGEGAPAAQDEETGRPDFYSLYASGVDENLLAQASQVPPPVAEQLEWEQFEARKRQEQQLLPTVRQLQPYRRRPNLWLSDAAVDDDFGTIGVDDLARVLPSPSAAAAQDETPSPPPPEWRAAVPDGQPLFPAPPVREDPPSPPAVPPAAQRDGASSSATDDHSDGDDATASTAADVQVVGYAVKLPTTTAATVPRGAGGGAAMWRVKRAPDAVTQLQTMAASAYKHVQAQWERQLLENRYLREALGLAAQTTQVLLDRAHSLAERYLSSMIADDPEQQHLQRIRRAHVWEHVALRCSLTSLSFRQRQLLAETRVESLADARSVAQMTAAQRSEYEQQQLRRVVQQLSELQALTDGDPHEAPLALPAPAAAAAAAAQLAPAAEAEEVDEDDFQYVLARFLTPPGFREDAQCHVCAQSFGVTLFRHHCRHCGASCCDDHSRQRRRIQRFGFVAPVRVCDRCADCLDELRRVDQLVWRDGRVRAWLGGRLLPVTYATLYGDRDIDRGVDKALRVADYSLSVARNALVLNFPTKVALETIEVLKRYGLTGFAGLLLTGEFMEAIETLKQLVRVDDMFPSLHELTACVYYKLAIDRGLRGCQPDAALETHRDTDLQRRMCEQSALLDEGGELSAGAAASAGAAPLHDCRPATERDLALAIRYAPLALDVVYEDSELDMRRLARHHGLELLCSNAAAEENEELRRRPEQPVYALFVPQAAPTDARDAGAPRPEAVLAVRGTRSVQDVVTDIRAAPMRFPPTDDVVALLRGRPVVARGQSPLPRGATADDAAAAEALLGRDYACEGMVRSALHVLAELGPALLRLVDSGCDVRVVGHSLGAAVAALLTLLLRRGLAALGVAQPARRVRGVAFSSPSCLSAALSDELLDDAAGARGAAPEARGFLSVVLRDDVITRVTPRAARQLLREILVFRDQVFRHLQQDWADVMRRARSLWAPRQPQAFAATGADAALLALLEDSQRAQRDAEADGDLAQLDADALAAAGELELWLPGAVLHVYPWRGQWLGAVVSRDFPPLRAISVQGHIFEDHRSHNVFNALLEAAHVQRLRSERSRRAVPPPWTAFDCADRCACCLLPFTWHSTFRGAAQEFRERYNCRNCGALVCGPCSTQRKSVPRLGMLAPRRVCDRCFLRGDFSA